MRSIISYCLGISKPYNIEIHCEAFQDCKILSSISLHTQFLTSPLRDLFATFLVSKSKTVEPNSIVPESVTEVQNNIFLFRKSSSVMTVHKD